MLSDRRQNVLKLLINEYIAHALPIGSRTLIDRYHLEISSATVRNELSYLEEEGYLTSPHTSAGRVPTDFGYRVFVDDLLENLTDSPSADVLGDLMQDATELDDLLDRTSQVLSHFTDCLAMVVPQGLISVSVKRITLVPLAPTRLLAVVITDEGAVFNRTIETGEELSPERVSSIEEALNELYAGKIVSRDSAQAAGKPESTSNLDDAAKRSAMIREMRKDPLALLVEQEIVESCVNKPTDRPHTLGLSRLLNQPEFSNATRLTPLVEKLEDETILFNLFTDSKDGDLPFVRIGHENGSDELSEVSIVATPYGADGREGMIAVIGPTRMNYEHVITAVRAARSLLQDS